MALVEHSRRCDVASSLLLSLLLPPANGEAQPAAHALGFARAINWGVRAKTGWIRGASSLSGCVESADGSRRWFSILMNYDRSKGGFNKTCKRIQEDIVAAVAGMSKSP